MDDGCANWYLVQPLRSCSSVGRCWTLCGERGESMRPGLKGLWFEVRQALDVYEPPGRYGYGC